jgi:hypothetical protein
MDLDVVANTKLRQTLFYLLLLKSADNIHNSLSFSKPGVC